MHIRRRVGQIKLLALKLFFFSIQRFFSSLIVKHIKCIYLQLQAEAFRWNIKCFQSIDIWFAIFTIGWIMFVYCIETAICCGALFIVVILFCEREKNSIFKDFDLLSCIVFQLNEGHFCTQTKQNTECWFAFIFFSITSNARISHNKKNNLIHKIWNNIVETH